MTAAVAGRRVLLAGATGLVGGFCLQQLLDEPSIAEVEAWTRRPLVINHPKLRVRIVDIDRLPDEGAAVHAIICCLGTTIRQAGSEAAFRKIDFEYPQALARYGEKTGATKFLMVSALGADRKSRVFYNRVKGEAENAVMASAIPVKLLFRPSLLLGAREEFRAAERVATLLLPLISPFLCGRWAKYRPIPAEAVARAMVRSALNREQSGILESDEIAAIAALK
ncbi:MAG: NAD(P)H-binding protein [Burkholderiales bacterium]